MIKLWDTLTSIARLFFNKKAQQPLLPVLKIQPDESRQKNKIVLAENAFTKCQEFNGFYKLIEDYTKYFNYELQADYNKSFVLLLGDIAGIADENSLFKNYDPIANKIYNIIIDMSTEAINIELDNSFFLINLRKLITIISQDKFNGFHFYLFNANTSMLKFKQKLEENSIDISSLTLIGWDFYIARFFLDLVKLKQDDIYKNYFKQIKNLSINKSQKRQKYFICMNHRPRWHRYATILSLLSRLHINKGYVSFAGEEKGRIDAPTVDTIEYAKTMVEKLRDGNKFLTSLATLTALTPIILDKDPTQIQNELWGKEDTGHLGQPLGIDKDNATGDLKFLSCYFEIVTETYFTNDSCSYITEKTLRPIISLRPFICVGTPYSLKKLKEYGFKSFSPYIDEKYDDVVDPIARMDLVLNEIDRLCSLDLDEIHKMYYELWDVIEFNYLHYLENFDNILKEKIISPVMQTFQNKQKELTSFQ